MSNKDRKHIATVEIDKQTYERLKNKAISKRYNTKQYINEILRMLLKKEDFLHIIAPHLSVEAYHGNRVVLKDFKIRRFVDVAMINGKLHCDIHPHGCEHIEFVWAIPELANLDIPESKAILESDEKGKKKLVEILA